MPGLERTVEITQYTYRKQRPRQGTNTPRAGGNWQVEERKKSKILAMLEKLGA